MNDPEMADEMAESGPEDASESSENEGGDDNDSYYLPAGAAPDGVKVGDVIPFRVEHISDDGEIQVCRDDKGESSNWRDELRKNVSEY